MIPPSLIQFLAKYAFQIVAVIIVICAYFAWAHHQQSIGEERANAETAKRDKRIAEESEKLMNHEKSLVEQYNKEQNERYKNAITIYAQRATDLNDDVSNLTKRMRQSANAAECNKDTVPRTVNDSSTGERKIAWTDREIEEYAKTAIQIENELEKLVNEIPVKDKK